jgi:DNA-binding SARP family transcriptional activator
MGEAIRHIMSPLYQMELLGTCRLVDLATGETVEFRTRKAKCLLGLLALSASGELNREQLASLLWDPAPEEQARASLRQALKEIREVLGLRAEDVISADRFVVALQASALDIDVRRFRDLIATADSDVNAALKAAALWKGELFGALLPSAPVFEAWVQVERSHLRSQLTKSLTDRLEALIRANDFSDARIAEELVRIEPSHELAHQYLMRFHAARGDQAAALRQYALLDRILAEELDSEPSKESNNLLVAVKLGDISLQRVAPKEAPPAIAVRLARQGPPKITIRPPLTRFSDASMDYLGEGFAYVAKVCMSRFRCWIVIPWPSKGYESDTAVDYTAVGQAIDADFVIDCVFDWRSPAGKLFVSLVDCRDGSQVWSNIYSVAANELQELGSTVAGAVAANLASQVNYISLLRYARDVPGSPAAYDMWLKGHQLSRLWNAEADETAAALFAQSIELDPGLACGYSSLASILNTRGMVRPGYKGRETDCATAFKLAQNAIALDPFDSRCHISMAWSWLIARSAERAKSHFKLAVELNPYDSETLIAAAMGIAFLGNMQEAQRWSTLALSLNPLYPEYFLGYLAAIHYLDGDYEATVAAVERCPDVFPDLAMWAAAAYAQLDKKREAVSAYGKFRALTAPSWEGGSPLLEDDLELWLLDIMPIVWPEGRRSFEQGIKMARRLAEKPKSQSTSATNTA